jgi:polyphenol oxidase
MTQKDKLDSRRNFLAKIGTDAAALLLPIALPQMVRGQVCAPPGNTSSPTAWGSDCRQLQPRRPASTLTSSEITKLRAAYQAMRTLDTSDPADPRGFVRQANVHCYMCSQAPVAQRVHYNDNFLPWHRAYLYFHERILGKLIGDMNFRIPYWDWENPAHRKLPPPHTTPSGVGNPMWDVNRVMTPADSLSAGVVDLTASLSSADYTTFRSTLESGPHGGVHVSVGGDMGAFDTAGHDPVFYSHHANVDKCWTDWVKASPSHTNPTLASWLNQSYGFYDENKVWRTIKNSQVVDNEGSLRYYYGTRSFEYITLACIIKWADLSVAVNAAVSGFTNTPATLRALQAAVGKAVVHLKVTAPQLPQDISAIYSVYISEREATEDKGAESPGFAGTISVVLGSKDHKHEPSATDSFVFDVTANVKSLAERREQNQLFAVQMLPKPATKRVLRVPFRSVSYRVGEIGQV